MAAHRLDRGPARMGWPTWRQVADYSLVGVLLLSIGNALVMWAEKTIPSGIAALIVGTDAPLADAARRPAAGRPALDAARVWLGDARRLRRRGPRGAAGRRRARSGHWGAIIALQVGHHRLDGGLALRAVGAEAAARLHRGRDRDAGRLGRAAAAVARARRRRLVRPSAPPRREHVARPSPTWWSSGRSSASPRSPTRSTSCPRRPSAPTPTSTRRGRGAPRAASS